MNLPPAGRYKIESAKDREFLGYVTIAPDDLDSGSITIAKLREREFLSKRIYAELTVRSETEMSIDGNNGVILYLISWPRTGYPGPR